MIDAFLLELQAYIKETYFYLKLYRTTPTCRNYLVNKQRG